METLKKRLGLHIRLQTSILDVLDRAEQLDLPFFQCFLVHQTTNRIIHISKAEWQTFLIRRRKLYDVMFCHASYWVNLSSLKGNGYIQLRREMDLAKRLEFTHMILHAGTAKGAQDKNEGIDALARAINRLLKYERNLTILFENTCHANLTIGSDITDFKILLEKLDIPERIGFCIDTAHAYSFGYDIRSDEGQKSFMNLLEETVGCERIALIHLNDTLEQCGAKIDHHDIPGKGKIGQHALKNFIMHPRLCHVPLIMELPELSVEIEKNILSDVCQW